LFFSPSEVWDFERCSTNAAAQLPVSGEPAKRASPSHPLRQKNERPLFWGLLFIWNERTSFAYGAQTDKLR